MYIHVTWKLHTYRYYWYNCKIHIIQKLLGQMLETTHHGSMQEDLCKNQRIRNFPYLIITYPHLLRYPVHPAIFQHKTIKAFLS